MSGSVAPSSVGLNDKRDIRQLLKFKPVFKIVVLHYRVLSYTLSFVIVITAFIVNEDLYTIVIYGVPNAIWMGIWNSPIVAFIFSQFFYFYLICKYLKMKINNLNKIVIESEKSNNYLEILRTLRKYNSLYKEIDEYNTTYWSKFLFIIWLYMGLLLTVLLFVVFFRDVFIPIKIIFCYALLIAFGIIHFMFIIASSLNSSVHRPYKLLNSIIAKHSADFGFLRLRQKIKVIIMLFTTLRGVYNYVDHPAPTHRPSESLAHGALAYGLCFSPRSLGPEGNSQEGLSLESLDVESLSL